MQHLPVLLRESLELLAPERGGLYVDCTIGLGGHAEALLRKAPGARLVGIDRDPEAIELAAKRLEPFGERVQLINGNFRDVKGNLGEVGIDRVDGGFLADLGVSSMQLGKAERGFSFQREGPLDMRMGSTELTAGDIVNRYQEGELVRIFKDYGEERRSRRIAREIVERRARGPLETTSELRELVARVTGPRRHGSGRRIDPATRVFQALRIEVNEELSGLERLLDQTVELLDQDGRLVVISYHSLEDRIVKHTLRNMARGEVDETTGRTRSETRVIELLTGKPVRPEPEEVAANPRSRSARLRAARRL